MKNAYKSTVAATGPQFLKAKPLAKIIGVSAKTVHRWAAAGHFQARKLTQRVVVFDLAEALRFVESARVGGNGAV